MKVLAVVVLILTNVVIPFLCQRQQSQTGRLLRIPRIYNAIITTDEELIPSQAYPAVAPVLRPAIPHFSVVVYNESEYQYPPVPLPPQELIPGPLPDLPPQGRVDSPLYNVQSQQRPPDLFDDRIKNNRNPNIPDVPPPPLPVKPPALQNKPSTEEEEPRRRPEDYPPQPSVPFF